MTHSVGANHSFSGASDQFIHAIFVPSGEKTGQVGSRNFDLGTKVVRPLPSRFMTTTEPPASKTIFCPSGDQSGKPSLGPLVRSVTPVPSTFTVLIPTPNHATSGSKRVNAIFAPSDHHAAATPSTPRGVGFVPSALITSRPV